MRKEGAERLMAEAGGVGIRSGSVAVPIVALLQRWIPGLRAVIAGARPYIGRMPFPEPAP